MNAQTGRCFLFLLSCLITALAVVQSKWTKEDIEKEIKTTKEEMITTDDERSSRVIASLDNIEQQLTEPRSDEENSKIGNTISIVRKAVRKFQSDNPLGVADGCMDMSIGLKDVSETIPESSVLSRLISNVIGLFDSTSTEKSVEKVLVKALKDENDKELLNNAHATKEVFRDSKAYLDGFKVSSGPLTDAEIYSLSTNIPIFQGVKMISLLIQRVEQARPTNHEEAQKIMNLLEMLIDLVLLRDCILTDLYCQVSTAKNGLKIASGLNGVKEMSKKRVKLGMNRVLKGDQPKQWVFLSHLYPKGRSTQTKKIFRFLNENGVNDLPGIERDLSGMKTISPMKWSQNCISAQSGKDYLLGNRELSESFLGECQMNLTKLNDGFYNIRVRGNYMAYASQTNMYVSRKPDVKSSRISFIPVKKGKKSFYIISSYEWPDMFAYMDHSKEKQIWFEKGNPDEESGQTAFWTVLDALHA